LWSDPKHKISWGMEDQIVSEKDRHLPSLAKIPIESLPGYSGD
jgi:dTDP-4-dehydrorhamnose 3,5-epimerase-like enzyme